MCAEEGTGKVIDSIPVGRLPQELAISRTQPYIFVSCMSDSLGSSSFGSVYVINYNTHKVVGRLEGRFASPHGIAVDDRNGKLYVFSTNRSNTSYQPHHSGGVCGSTPGYYRLFDLHTLQPDNGKFFEVLSEPYSADVRFK